MKHFLFTLAITSMMLCPMGAEAQETKEMKYPQAEWTKAGDILMHTPGQELFNGVIHPKAGLFDNYFDVDKAADEHKGYISMLEKNGIRVHKVTDILNEVGIDTLQTLATSVLVYDVSAIPDEDQTASQRAPETKIIKTCYEHLGLKPILQISGEGRLEGGDYIPAGTVSFIGCGMRTNEAAIKYMLEKDAFGHDTVVVVKDHKLWQMQMHLDTHFNIIDKDLCTMVSSRLNAAPGTPEYNTCDIWARKPGTLRPL